MIAPAADIPLTGSQIKPATKFNKARMPVVVSLGRDVAIRAACADAAAQLPTHPYKFVRVATLTDAGAGAHVDGFGGGNEPLSAVRVQALLR